MSFVQAASANLPSATPLVGVAMAKQADAHRSTVITAFQNVADTLRALRAPLKAATAAETAAHKSLEITHKRLLLEEVTYVALLNRSKPIFNLLWHVCRRKPTDTWIPRSYTKLSAADGGTGVFCANCSRCRCIQRAMITEKLSS
ncbi:MAG: hypothetical protein WCC90_12955 [Methylocella sp.]